MAERRAAELFGLALGDERQRQRLSQRALAERAGMSGGEISRLERGRRDPRLSTAVRLARALGVVPSDLLREVR